MKVLLVYPEFPDTFWSFKHALPFQGKRSAYPPLGLLTVAGMLPARWQKRLVDMNVRRLKDSDLDWADVVFFSGMMVQGPSMKQAIARSKQRGRRTVVGGPIASAADPAIAEADHVVEGEAEELIAGLAADLERGEARTHYKASQLPDLTVVPLPELRLSKLGTRLTAWIGSRRRKLFVKSSYGTGKEVCITLLWWGVILSCRWGVHGFLK